MKFWLVILLTAIGVSHADNAAIRDLRSAHGDLALDIVNGSKHGFSSHFAIDEEREVIVQSLDKIAKNNRSDVWDRLYKPANVISLQQQEHILNAYTIITALQELAKTPGRNFGDILRETLDKCFAKSGHVFQIDRKRIENFSGYILSLEEFLKKTFTTVEGYSPRWVNLDTERSKHYFMDLPQAPIIHPYHPDINTRDSVSLFQTVFNVKLPASAYVNLPENIRETLRSRGVSPQKTDVFFLTENNPWNNPQLLLRPQIWVGKEGHSVAVQAGIFSDDSSVTMDGTANEVHPGTSHMHDGLSSPGDTMKLSGLDYQVTKSFYPVVIDGDRAVVTLLWMLNDEDQAAIERLSLKANNMQDFMAALNGNVRFAPHFAKLKSLLRY